MAAENVEIVRRVFDAFNRGDFETALDLLDEDVEWGGPPDVPDETGPYRGHDGVVAGFRNFMKVWERLDVELVEVIDAGDRVVAVNRWHGRSRGHGVDVDLHVSQVLELRDGKVTRVRQFRERDEALAAARGG